MRGLVTGIDFDKVGSAQGRQVPQHELGDFIFDRFTDASGNEWRGFFQYARAEGAVTAGRFAYIDNLHDARVLNTTNSAASPKAVGVAVATLADEECGWFWRGCGTAEALVANGVSADTLLTTTATDGEAGTGGDAIIGLVNVDAGVTSTLVGVFAVTLMATNS